MDGARIPELIDCSNHNTGAVFAVSCRDKSAQTLYALMAVAVWGVPRSPGSARRGITLFAIQLTLDLGWSVLFFGLESPGLALIELCLLVFFIAATMARFRSNTAKSRAAPATRLAFATESKLQSRVSTGRPGKVTATLEISFNQS